MRKGYNNNMAGVQLQGIDNQYAQLIQNPEILEYGGDIEAYLYPPTTVFTLSGWYIDVNNSVYYQTANNANLYILYGSDWQQVYTKVKQHSQAESQKLVNGIISNNKFILENNLLAARFSHKLNENERAVLFTLQARLDRRNEALLNNNILQNKTESFPQGYAALDDYLSDFMREPGIGFVVSTTAVIVVSAIVVAALSTAAYFAYKAYYNESAEDVKYSKQLTETLLSRLTQEEYDALLKETQGIVTKAVINQKLASVGGNLKTLFLIFLGIVIATQTPKWLAAAQEPAPKRLNK